MTEDQFMRLEAVEIAKLGALQGILSTLQALAIKQGAQIGGTNWKSVGDALKQATALQAKQLQAGSPEKAG